MFKSSKNDVLSMAGRIKPRRGAIIMAVLAGFGAASASANGLTVGLGGLGAVTVGGSSVANVNTNVAGVGVKADMLGNDHVATGCVGSCASGTSGNVGPGGGIGGNGGGIGVNGVQGVVPVNLNTRSKALVTHNAMLCKANGNTAVYNGFTVMDRHGVFVGWVNDTKLDTGLKITEVRMQTADNHCVAMVGGNFKISGSQMIVTNIDAAQLP